MRYPKTSVRVSEESFRSPVVVTQALFGLKGESGRKFLKERKNKNFAVGCLGGDSLVLPNHVMEKQKDLNSDDAPRRATAEQVYNGLQAALARAGLCNRVINFNKLRNFNAVLAQDLEKR